MEFTARLTFHVYQLRISANAKDNVSDRVMTVGIVMTAWNIIILPDLIHRLLRRLPDYHKGKNARLVAICIVLSRSSCRGQRGIKTWASSVPPDENSSELARTYRFRALFIYRFCKGLGNKTKLYPQYP